jgi:hypothetical protein
VEDAGEERQQRLRDVKIEESEDSAEAYGGNARRRPEAGLVGGGNCSSIISIAGFAAESGSRCVSGLAESTFQTTDTS